MKEESKGLLNEMNIKENCTELLDHAIGLLMADPVATKNFYEKIAKMPSIIKEAYYWNKFYLFLDGVKKIENDLEQRVTLSSKLFDNPKDKKQNGMRLLGYIDKADSEQKIDYFINATRSLLMGYIDNSVYFRIMKAVSETLNEDLEHLAKIAVNNGILKGNTQILALERSGLVIPAVIDANDSIESQGYAVSSFGRMVDQFAISFEDDERQKLYKKEVQQHKFEAELPTATDEDIKSLFE